jgi:dihydroorotase-like cyclic amidohydrolase
VSVSNFEKLSKKAIKGGVRTVVLNPDMNRVAKDFFSI